MKKRAIILFIYLLFINQLHAQEGEPEFLWLKENSTKKGAIRLYQPQLDSYNNNVLESRPAFCIITSKKDIVFGVVWSTARVSTDKEERNVSLEKLDIIKVHFPDFEDQTKVDQFGAC